jgi:hypothetical protein
LVALERINTYSGFLETAKHLEEYAILKRRSPGAAHVV